MKIKLTIMSLILSIVLFNHSMADVFTDVSSNHPNYQAINYLEKEGIISGYADHTFKPDKNVNRVEALKIILLGSNVFVPNIQAQEIFPDVLYDAWYGKYVSKAKKLGIIKGDGNTGYFRPGDTVNLAEALKILINTKGIKLPKVSKNPYWDVPYDAWFAPYFEYARLANLLDGTENIKPSQNVDRAMLAEIMYRFINNKVIIADGKASYYGEMFHGKTTASGEIFDASAFTAAHLSYPFGTKLKVTNVENGKSVVVRVNDRGPYVSDPDRIIDLSKAAFEYISPLSRGIIKVKVEETNDEISVADKSNLDTDDNADKSNLDTDDNADKSNLDTDDNETSKNEKEVIDILNTSKASSCNQIGEIKFIKEDSYKNIKLDNEIPNKILLNDVLNIKGSVSKNTDIVSAFVVDNNNNQNIFTSKINGDKFDINIKFPSVGNYKLGLVLGKSGSSAVFNIEVLKNTCIEEVEDVSLSPISYFEMGIEKGDTIFKWDKGDYNLFKISFLQDGLKRTYIVHDIEKFIVFYKDFKDFNKSNIKVSIRGAKLTKKSLLEPVQIVWSPEIVRNFIAATHYEYIIDNDKIDLINLNDYVILQNTIKANFIAKTKIRSKAALILPNGSVKSIDITGNDSLENNSFNIELIPASNKSLKAEYKTTSTGVHFLEINNENGLAILNVPIYIKSQYPLIPSPRDLSDNTAIDLGNDYDKLKTEALNLVNADRKKFNLKALVMNDKLNKLAQYRSDIIVSENFFSHWDKNGVTANDIKLNYGVQNQVGENLSKDINLELSEYGLMRSAVHRSNILNKDWINVGFGITKKDDGSYILVQIFSDDLIDINDEETLKTSILNTINKDRSVNLLKTENLDKIAKNWSVKMVNEDFFAFTDNNGNALLDSIYDSGITSSLGTFIMANSSFADVIEQVKTNTQLHNLKWKNIGIGLNTDKLGIIKITFIYTE